MQFIERLRDDRLTTTIQTPAGDLILSKPQFWGALPWHAKQEQMAQEQETPTPGTQPIPNPDLALPMGLTRQFLIDKCDYFSDIGIWPRKSVLNPELWLRNFLPHEEDHALYLLNAFMYFATDLVDQIFSTSIRTIGRLMTRHQWTEFLDSVLVTLVTGEVPNVTDSGHVFTRKARSLGIPEERIMSHEQVFGRIQAGFNQAVVLVDDFGGSGTQFIETWNRTPPNRYESFRALATGSQAEFYYCPAFCTQFGLNRIKCACPEVTVNPGVLIPDNYGALAPDSIVWPSELRSTAEEFLYSASTRAGIPEGEWRGFASLGLTIAFEDSVPDATLPIMYWENNENDRWHPLMRRTA